MTDSGKKGGLHPAVAGFAGMQAFMFSLFYLGTDASFELGWVSLFSADQLAVLICMFITCLILSRLTTAVRDRLFQWNVMWACGIAMAAATVFPLIWSYAPTFQMLAFVLHSIVVGAPTALMLCAWGRAFGDMPLEDSVLRVFVGSAVGAALCFVCAVVPIRNFTLVLHLLPLLSAGVLSGLFKREGRADRSRLSPDDHALSLGGRMLAGTFVYGFATGAMESLSLLSDSRSVPNFTLTFFLFGMFCLAAILTFRPRKAPRRLNGEAPTDDGGAADAGPLDGAYRAALLVMLAGFLVNPLLSSTALSGEVIVLAGYLGVETVMISLFVVMGRLTGRDSTVAFALGFAFLFVGEIFGVLIGGAIGSYASSASFAISCITVVAGIAVLCAFLYLFTDDDLRALSVVVRKSDRYETVRAEIVGRFGLSKRESEILDLAMRGRTGERIAGELFISKNTVETHLRRIYGKCGVHSRQELIDLVESMM